MEIVVRSAKERPSRDGLATHPRRDPRRALEDVRQTKRVALPSDIQITARASMSLDCVVNPLRASADTASMYDGSVSARCLRRETSSTSEWREVKGEGRGIGRSFVRLVN